MIFLIFFSMVRNPLYSHMRPTCTPKMHLCLKSFINTWSSFLNSRNVRSKSTYFFIRYWIFSKYNLAIVTRSYQSLVNLNAGSFGSLYLLSIGWKSNRFQTNFYQYSHFIADWCKIGQYLSFLSSRLNSQLHSVGATLLAYYWLILSANLFMDASFVDMLSSNPIK